jgi:hypothetical protein
MIGTPRWPGSAHHQYPARTESTSMSAASNTTTAPVERPTRRAAAIAGEVGGSAPPLGRGGQTVVTASRAERITSGQIRGTSSGTWCRRKCQLFAYV